MARQLVFGKIKTGLTPCWGFREERREKLDNVKMAVSTPIKNRKTRLHNHAQPDGSFRSKLCQYLPIDRGPCSVVREDLSGRQLTVEGIIADLDPG